MISDLATSNFIHSNKNNIKSLSIFRFWDTDLAFIFILSTNSIVISVKRAVYAVSVIPHASVLTGLTAYVTISCTHQISHI